MTSVSLPSSTGPLHGGYSSVREDVTDSEGSFEAPRTVKRCLSSSTADSCKKRRKQSTPIRISNDLDQTTSNNTEGKLVEFSPDPNLSCPVCHIHFDTVEQLQTHIGCDHPVECKREPDDPTENSPTSYMERSETPLSLTVRPEIPWMGEVQNKDWMNPNIPNIAFNPANPVFMAMTQFSQPENLPMKPIRIFNPDAYCDLCNKEFCNKYFLKTHKANKHGIYTDTPSSDQMPNSVNIPSFTGNMKLPTSVPSVDLSIKTEPKTSASLINSYSDVFPNPFSSKFSRQTLLPEIEPNENITSASVPTSNGPLSSSESEKLMIEEQTVEECSNPSITQTESTSIKNDPDGNFYDSIKMSPGQISREFDASQRYRRFGVMNPKAFCEICCKEYCNKYFLRTHKMKRHGIYIPDDRDMKMESVNSFSWPPSVQTSPLNLIMTEQTGMHDRKTTSPNDISCEICGIRFQNASLAQLHNFTVHGKMNGKEQDHIDNSIEESKGTPEPPKATEKSLNPEAISEDLQKLQTMILQLNDLDVSKVTTCGSCNKEFENKFYLHSHMVTEHGLLPDDGSDVDKTADSESSNNNTLCDLCGKDVQNTEEMKKHIIEAHSAMNTSNGDSNKDEYNDVSTADKIGNRSFGTPGSISDRRFTVNVTPTSSYCEICNKELCNKYFMKTHMQRMHGIEIENGSQIGGVVCDICNKELCSKYFLRVHKHNTHGIVEYGTSLLQPRKSESEPPPPPLVPTEPDPSLKVGDLADLSHRYFTHFTEVCPICSRRFRSTKWLKAHLISDHGQAGVEKWNELEQQLQQNFGQNPKPSSTTIKSERTSPSLKIPNGSQESSTKKVGIQNVLSSIFGVDELNAKTYQCSYCPFTSPLLPLLFIHERSHSVSANGENFPIKCPVCPQSFLQRELFQRHLYTNHPFLPLPPLFNGNTNHSEMSRESQENIEESDVLESRVDNDSTISLEPGFNNNSQNQNQTTPKIKKQSPIKLKRVELPTEFSQSLKDVAKKTQMPATYAVPQSQNRNQEQAEESSSSGYVMQAFLLEESAAERRVVPSVVFLPMLQKQPAPLTVTFTLTPA